MHGNLNPARKCSPEMQIGKKILKHPVIMTLLSMLIAAYIRFAYHTSHVTRVIPQSAQPYARGEKNAIYVFWHGRMLLMPMMRPPGRPIHIMISHHRDGELIARAMHRFSFGTVRGSSSKGAVKVSNDTLTALSAGDNVSITPDGPRGPFQIAAKGAVSLAKIAQVPVVAVSFSASRRRRIASWDRFLLAYPFSRMEFRVAEPIFIPQNADDEALERYRAQMESTLIRLGEEADQQVA